jgi:hypothetical protein
VESASLIAEGKTGIHIMRTIPMALTWELLTRGRRLHVLMTCAGLALPMLIYTALSLQGAIDPGDPAYIVIHLTMVQINVFVFGSGVMQAMGNVSRLYPYPARTSTLVAWQLLPAMAIVGVETLFSSVILNWLFDGGIYSGDCHDVAHRKIGVAAVGAGHCRQCARLVVQVAVWIIVRQSDVLLGCRHRR